MGAVGFADISSSVSEPNLGSTKPAEVTLPEENFSVSELNLGLTKPAEVTLQELTFSAKEIHVTEWKGDILAVGVFEKDVGKNESGVFANPTLEKLDSHVGGLLSNVMKEEDFSGKAGQTAFVRPLGFGFKRLGLIGLGGKNGSASLTSSLKGFAENLARAAKTAQATEVAVTLVSTEDLSVSLKLNAVLTIAAGVLLGIYEDTRFKSEAKNPFLKCLDFLGLGSGPEFEQKFKYIQQVCSGVILTRQLVNAPANIITPRALANEASNIASAYSDVLTAKILDVEQCEELKMGSYLGVAAASANPPNFIHLCYKPPTGDVKTKLAIVGKGVTFDSGGYNIKAGPGIETMKIDMGGSAAALGAANAIGQIKPLGVEVHFVVAACENMISGTGMRPGDIVTASNGKTIEVLNTDAEGRLTLADALVYACKQGVHKVVDLATLTGACTIALGDEIAGIYTPNDELAEEISKAAEIAGEKFWRMPLEESYWESMKSEIADMVNTRGGRGGSIKAALFLKQFVDENVQWLHIDMIGPVWSNEKRGATGFAVSTLVEWVLENSS